MEPALRTVLLRRCRMLVASGLGRVDPAKKAVLLVEAFSLGFLIDNPEGYSDDLLNSYLHLMPALAKMRGGQVAHVPLYSEFPDRVPEQGAYLSKRLLGQVINCARWDVPGKVTEGGYVIPEWLFDLEHFGANPISQMQDLGLFLKAKFAQVKRLREPPKAPTRLRIVTPEQGEEALKLWLGRCLKSKTSYPPDYGQDFLLLLAAFGDPGLTPREVKYREHRAMLTVFLWTSQLWPALERFCQTPNDLLRTFAGLTGTDVSLAKPIKYPPLSKGQRRFVLGCLEGMRPADLVEDQMHKYRGLWLKLERGLHSGQYRGRFPKTWELFAKLRSGQTRPRFSALEIGLRLGDANVIKAELERFPAGVALRRFAHVLAVAGGLSQWMLERLESASLKDLLMLHNVVRRDGWATRTLILTKRGATQVIPRRPGRMDEETRRGLVAELESRLLAGLSRRYDGDWAGQRIYIDPELRQWVLPLSLRSASESLITLGRGSRLPLGDEATVRLYVYWKQRFQTTDLDLSAITFDQSGACTGYVDWTRLKGKGLVHSGDLQSAPLGAAEFIDANINELRKAAGRYLAASVFRYRGDHFGQMTCFTGWMTRDRPDAAYQTFDPATVRQKMDLAGEASYAIPFVVDLQEREVLWLDLSVYALAQQSQVANSFHRLEQLVGAGRELALWAPTLAQLADLHVRARGGEQTDQRAVANIVFSTDPSADYHPGDWPRILSELL